MVEFLNAPLLVLHFFLLYINGLPDTVVCSAVYSKYDQECGLWQQLELASEVDL